MYSENMLRIIPCYHCVHCVEEKDMKRGRFTKRKCDLTNRWGSMNKAYFCNKFEDRRSESSTYEYNGHRVRKDQIEDYRTERQWAEVGYCVKEDAVGYEMYATRMAGMHNGPTFIYYLPDQVMKIGDPENND